MFYSQFILAKKGPLGTIWIAAHLERKLRKNQVTETNISVSVDSILFPEVPIALRLSGHLLLGVVRIYSRKVNYLFHDCSEALVKIKQAFHAGAVDLPPEAATAPFHSITLPETFDLDEFEPLLDKELNSLHANGAVDHHITSREQITLQDPLEDSTYLGSSQFELDERFPDGDAPQLEIDFDEDLLDKRDGAGSQAASPLHEEDELPLEEDVIPPARMDDELDYDQMDRMDEMDIDDHHEPGTPALGLDNMDLDYQREPDEQLDAGHDGLERLEPSLAMDHEDLGATDLGAERLPHEPTTPGSPENEALEYKESGFDLDLEANVEHALEEGDVEHRVVENIAAHGGEKTAEFDQGETAEHGVEEKIGQGEEAKVDEGVERELEEQDDVVKPQLETGMSVLGDKTSDDDKGEVTLIEGQEAAEVQEAGIQDEQAAEGQEVGIQDEQAAEGQEAGIQDEQAAGRKIGDEAPEDLPEYETVMSAPGITNQDPDVFDMDPGMGMEPASDVLPYEDAERTAEDGALFFEEAHPGFHDERQPFHEDPQPFHEEQQPFHEEPQPAMAGTMSPMRSPPVPVISSEYLPGDDDLLASLPGRRASALALVPTPVDNVAKPRRRQGQRKRKIIIDLGTILGADVMKQQLENTDDIRRVRRKAPCTRQELWSVQKESLNQQLFCEHSVPGLCGELRVLFERVYVVGEANLPQAEPVEPDVVPGEELPEPQQLPVVEDLNADINVEVHPDDVKELDNELAGSPVINEGVPDAAPVDHQQTEDAGAPDPLNTVERVSSPIEDLAAKTEEAQNLQIRTPVSEHGDQAPLESPKEELSNVLDTEVVNPVDLNSASLEMEEAMETVREQEAMEIDVQEAVDTSAREEMELLGRLGTPETAVVGEYHPMIDVNVTNPEEDNDGLGGNFPEFGNAPQTEGFAGPAHGPATVSSDAEYASGTLTLSEAETEPYVRGEVEETQRIDTQVGLVPGDDMHGVGPAEFDTQIVPTEEHLRQEEEEVVYVPQGETEVFVDSLPDDNTGTDDTQLAVPFETAPVQEQPEEDLEFLADARDTEFLGADDDDLVEEPEDFQELNEYARKEPVSHDNSGWSARTRAVGHFLRITLEDKDAYMQRRNEQGVAKLGLERMLVGKSRKEAARMFFETLVLKTKDYIHVEQEEAYGDIQISARPKLMKAKF